MNAHTGPWHSVEPFFIDIFTAASAFPVLTTINCLDGFLNASQTRETAFVDVVKEISVMADGGQIALVFSVFELDFVCGEPVAVYRLNQLLIIARQPLSRTFDLLCVQFFRPRVLQPNNRFRMQARRSMSAIAQNIKRRAAVFNKAAGGTIVYKWD